MMDLKDLQSAWNNFSSREADKHRLDENAIRELLKTRTKNVVDKVERNIKIGMGALFVLLVLFLGGNWFVDVSVPQGHIAPWWLDWIDWVNSALLGGTFLYFILRYYSIRKDYAQISNLRDALNRIIKTLVVYKVLFHFALFVLLLIGIIEFVTGMYGGMVISAHRNGGTIEDLNTKQLFWAVLYGIGILVVLISIVYLLLRWGFRRLYGDHLKMLQSTLKELDEIDEKE